MNCTGLGSRIGNQSSSATLQDGDLMWCGIQEQREYSPFESGKLLVYMFYMLFDISNVL